MAQLIKGTREVASMTLKGRLWAPALSIALMASKIAAPTLAEETPKYGGTLTYMIPADGTDVFRNFIIRTGLTRTEYIRGAELRLDNKRVVHHANLVLDRTQ